MPSLDAITIAMLIYLMLATGAYETDNSTPSSMEDPYAQDIEYKSY